MTVQKVWALYFSPTGTTKKVVSSIAHILADTFGTKLNTVDFTLPDARLVQHAFCPSDVIVLGTPVIAGRVPNVLLNYLGAIKGGGAAAIPVVLYGNRNYDDALIELRDILEKDGFHTAAAGAFIGEHSFSRILAKDRPDDKDMAIAHGFACEIAQKLRLVASLEEPIYVNGAAYPYSGYYQPKDRHKNAVDIRKVTPLTNQACIGCKLCARICPMGSISFDDVSTFTGICIKCGACIKGCPQHAKYYCDPGYLYHQHELEEEFKKRSEPSLFL